MRNSNARSRARAAATVAVTLGIIVAEFLFLTWLTHLNDDAQDRAAAHAAASSALEVWQPGTDRAPVVAAIERLADSGVDDADQLRTDADAWRVFDDSVDRDTLVADVATTGDQVQAELSRVNRQAVMISIGVLMLISLGWFVWFRRLVDQHREMERELTERHAVDASEHRLLALVRNSTDLVVVIGEDGTVSFVSPAVTALLGHQPEALVGAQVSALVSEADQPVLQQLLHTRRTDEHPVQLRLQHRDGREVVVEGTLNNLLDDVAVHGFVLTVRDVTERQRLEDDLSRQSFHDSLTGLANRQLFFDRLGHALTRRSDRPRPLVVLLLDLDDFKEVNDSLGHDAGDQLLCEIAERLTANLRPGDTAARLGGDEFAVLLEATYQATASQLAYNLLATLSAPVELAGQSHSVHASIGLAEAMPGESDPADVVRNADVAMYMAKERGKSDVAVYDSAWHQRALETVSLRQELEHAVDAGELVLHYQPTVDLHSQAITGFEALVRWPHPTRGLVPPNDFIPLAEQSSLIVLLGNWVLRTAVRDVASMQSPAHRPTVAVNVAAKQLVHPDFVAVVRSALAESGLPADRLVLEITETALLQDVDLGVRALGELRGDGIRVAIDDFGTGYSSLSHLSRLPVDVLKVDKSFVDRLREDGDDVLVSAILAMSQGMRLQSVAEGVEEASQAAWLRDASCTLGQGYLWSRPVELAAARALLAENVERLGLSGEMDPFLRVG
jgi:diguanylate cyclase (GGDEF)-like protein/PAS domain S-box-containing protein